MNEPRGTYFDFLKLGNDSTDAVHPPDIFGGENSQTGERGISRGLQPQRRRGTDEDSE